MDLLYEILRHPEFVEALALGLTVGTAGIGGGLGYSVVQWIRHRIETEKDEREERQARDRIEQRHRHRLDVAEKLETVASIVVVDKSLAEGLRDKIEVEYPRVRVEQEAVEEEEEKESVRRRKRSKR